jgi:hypothetical protein
MLTSKGAMPGYGRLSNVSDTPSLSRIPSGLPDIDGGSTGLHF